MVNPVRVFKHLFMPDWLVRLRFNQRAMQQIESAIAQSEKAHGGEIRFAVEANLSLRDLLANRSARERALDVFSGLRIWDTEQNNGVLIYLLLADHDVEIVADRGINSQVSADEWEQIAQMMESHCRAGEFTTAVLAAIEAISHVLMRHYPATGREVNELSNEPVVISSK
jgi:uncharacterized membrane protein